MQISKGRSPVALGITWS